MHLRCTILFRTLAALSFGLGQPLSLSAQDPGFDVGATPAWVEPTLVDQDLLNSGEQTTVGVRYVLTDRQTRVEGNGLEQYRHVARQAVNEAGMSAISQLSVDFDPSYQTLQLHFVRILRGEQKLDRLDRHKVDILKREATLEYQLYDGTVTAHLVLDDVRVGDIVEYAYTVTGSNPTLNGKFFDDVYLGAPVPVLAVRYRLLWPADRVLHVRNHGTDIRPQIKHLGDSDEYLWLQTDRPAILVDDDLPTWYEPFPFVQLSEADSWAEVAHWGWSLYRPKLEAGKAVRNLARSILDSSSSEEERLVKALQFVENDIRYTARLMGRGAFEPDAPDRVLEQRFGDCKGKSLLLVALLKELGIEARPALVSTEIRQEIYRWHPSPMVFDHVIVRALLGGSTYWLDPTKRFQAGTLNEVTQANFGKALVLDDGSLDLETIPQVELAEPNLTVEKTFDMTLGVGKMVTMHVVSTFRGTAAESARNAFRWQSIEEIEKSDTEYYSQAYPDIDLAYPLMVDDDSVSNVLVVEEGFDLFDAWVANEDSSRLTFTYSGLEIASLVDYSSVNSRSMPLALSHPVYQVERVRFELPREWSAEAREQTVEDSAFRFDRSVSPNRDIIDMEFAYRSLSDHVDVDDLLAFRRHLEEAHDMIGYAIMSPPDGYDRLQASDYAIVLLFFALSIGGAAVPVYRVSRRHGLSARQFVSVRGRFPRSVYWLAVTVGGLILVLVSERYGAPGVGQMEKQILVVVFVLHLVPSWIVQIRRWHDLNRSGWWSLINFVPYVGLAYSVLMCGFFKGTVGENRFGPDPLEGVAETESLVDGVEAESVSA